MTVKTLFYATRSKALHWLVCAECIPAALKEDAHCRVLAECVVEPSETCVFCGAPGSDAADYSDDDEDQEHQQEDGDQLALDDNLFGHDPTPTRCACRCHQVHNSEVIPCPYCP